MTSRFDGPDQIPPVTTMGEIESRVGIPSLESLHAERDELVKVAADLKARHGSFGSYEALRKVEWCRIATAIRTQAIADGTKMTEAAIEQAAHASGQYIDWLTNATLEKAKWATIENRINDIADLIQRGNVICRYLTAEVNL